MTSSTPPAKPSALTAPRPAIGKGKALMLAERAAKGLRTRRPKPHPLLRRRPRFASHHQEDRPPATPDTLRLPLSPEAASVHASLPGGNNPPTTWQHWLGPSSFFPQGVGHGIAPTLAMAHVGADYKAACVYASARMGKTWHRIYSIKTTIH